MNSPGVLQRKTWLGQCFRATEQSPARWRTVLGAIGPFRAASDVQAALRDSQEEGVVDSAGMRNRTFKQTSRQR